MEQLNNPFPDIKEGQLAVKDSTDKNSPLFIKIRQNFGIYGGISLIFGVAFTLLFYKVGVGFNIFAFSCIMVLLLLLIMKKLSVPLKKGTIAYYLGTISLGLSSMLTSSWILLFLNIIGILLLLDLSLIHQFNEDSNWNFSRKIGSMFVLPLVTITTIGMPFQDTFKYFKSTKLFKNDRFMNITTGIIIAVPLLWVIIGLLSSADLIFGKLTNEVYDLVFSSNIFTIIIMVIFGFLVCYCIICGATMKAGSNDFIHERKKASASIAVTVLLLLGIVYIMFCSVQVLYLFNNGVFVLPSEFTYAEYARRGFFELLAVTVINIVLMLICTSFFEESKFVRILLTAMTACTYIMIASAVYRMILYISAYNLTFLRLFVLLFLLIDSLVLIGVIVSVYRKRFPLFGYSVCAVTICYLIFSFARPDYFIAKYHIQEKENMEYTDIVYLTESLSFDAAPVLIPYFKEKFPEIQFIPNADNTEYYTDNHGKEEVIKNYYNRISSKEKESGLREYNVSYSLAIKSLKSIEE